MNNITPNRYNGRASAGRILLASTALRALAQDSPSNPYAMIKAATERLKDTARLSIARQVIEHGQAPVELRRLADVRSQEAEVPHITTREEIRHAGQGPFEPLLRQIVQGPGTRHAVLERKKGL
jgi:hypothetical protein